MERFVRASIATEAVSGSATLSVQVPGIFVTPNHTDPSFSGRVLISTRIWFASPSAGDYVFNTTVTDTDGVIPIGIRGNFPTYPIIEDRDDTAVPLGNQGLYLPPAGLLITPPANTSAIPSQLYLNLSVQKGSPVVDTLYVNITWDDGT